MNFIFISPNYPPSYWQFCQRLRESGATVLGIGDAPYFELSEALRNCLTEYYYLNSLHDYEQVYRAVAFFIFKYGRIDWLDSNNGYWTEQDARLRSDFNIRSGPGLGFDVVGLLQSGAFADYLGETAQDDRGVGWHHVRLNGVEGWVSGKYSNIV